MTDALIVLAAGLVLLVVLPPMVRHELNGFRRPAGSPARPDRPGPPHVGVGPSPTAPSAAGQDLNQAGDA